MSVSHDAPRALYAQLLGASWCELAEPLRRLHASDTTVRARGRLRITHGRGRFARLLARLLRLPRQNDSADAQLIITHNANAEQWRRSFDERHLDTDQYASGNRELAERFGVLEFRFRLEAIAGVLHYQQLGVALVIGSFRVRLPDACAPLVDAREEASGPRQLQIRVSVAIPALGPVLTYDGAVDIEAAAA